jgi:oxygen-independent coproporphyrinogen-3 oxidase
MADTVILGLRLTEGVALDGLRERFGVGLEERYAQEISELTGLGLLELGGGRLRLTKRGRLLANEAFLRFLP